MKKNKIVVVSNKFDNHTDGIVACLNQTKFEVVRINTEDFRDNQITFKQNDRNKFVLVTPEKRTINPAHVKSVYVRRITAVDVSNVVKEYQRFTQDETEVVLSAFPNIFHQAKWMDHPHTRTRASNKITQLMLAKKCGFLLPETLISNDSKSVRKFCKSRKIIYKTLSRPIIDFGDRGNGIVNTTLLTNSNIQQLIKTTRVAPCLLQIYVEKAYELRIHIIGNEIIAVKIDSQQNNKALIDWRVADFDELNYVLYKLPIGVKNKIQKFMKVLGLNFGIIDMIVTPENKYVFLELNPNGNWWWIEKITNIKISHSIVNWLVN